MLSPRSTNKVLKLKRSLYGLKEPPKCWNNAFNQFVQHQGLNRFLHDVYLYYNKYVWVVVFVDGLLVIGKSDAVCCF